MPAEYLSGLQATLAQRESFWMRSIESDEPKVWVAEVDGQVVGWISVGASRGLTKPFRQSELATSFAALHGGLSAFT